MKNIENKINELEQERAEQKAWEFEPTDMFQYNVYTDVGAYVDGADEQKQIDTKKLLELVEYVYELLKLNKNPEDIYPILSWMCRNGYFTNFEFKDEDIFINGKQITKDGLLIILNNE